MNGGFWIFPIGVVLLGLWAVGKEIIRRRQEKRGG